MCIRDSKRNGTTTLFAALNTANGEVFGVCQEKHRHQEWLKFLRMIDQTIPADKEMCIRDRSFIECCLSACDLFQDVGSLAVQMKGFGLSLWRSM